MQAQAWLEPSLQENISQALSITDEDKATARDALDLLAFSEYAKAKNALDFPALSEYTEPRNGRLLAWHVLQASIYKKQDGWYNVSSSKMCKNCWERRKGAGTKLPLIKGGNVESFDIINAWVSFDSHIVLM